MREKVSLKLTTATRMWVTADNLFPPFVNQMVLEGKGEYNIMQWQKAVKNASAANPGSRFILKGSLGTSRWVDSGVTPHIRLVDGSNWDGKGPANAPFLNNRLDPVKGPACEILIIQGDPLRIVFRTHHGVMDGRGTMTWAEDIFRSLRHEDVAGSDVTVTEGDLLNITSSKIEKTIAYDFISPSGRAEGHDRGLTWRRLTINGKFHKLVPRIMMRIANEAWKHSEGRVRFGIPVDMRPRMDGLRSTHNLTNAIYIDVAPDSTVEDLARIIKKRVDACDDGTYTWEDKLIRHVPFFLLNRLLAREVAGNHRTGNYRYTGFISNLGRVPLENFSGGGFSPESCFFIPPGVGFLPCFLTLTGSGNTIEFAMTMPKALAENNRLNDLLGKVIEDLKPAGAAV